MEEHIIEIARKERVRLLNELSHITEYMNCNEKELLKNYVLVFNPKYKCSNITSIFEFNVIYDNRVKIIDKDYIVLKIANNEDDLYYENYLLTQQLQQYKQQIDELKQYIKGRIQVLEVSYSNDKNDEYLNAKLFGAKKELEYILSNLNQKKENNYENL